MVPLRAQTRARHARRLHPQARAGRLPKQPRWHQRLGAGLGQRRRLSLRRERGRVMSRPSTALPSHAERRYRLKRRALLAALGGATVGAFLPRLGIAEDAAPIKRLVLVFQPNGVIMDNWRPAGATLAGAPLGELSRSLAAFEPLKSKISVVTGLNQKSYGFDNHQQGMGGLWTGSRMLPESELSKPAPENAALADGPSIDQVVAQASKGSTRFDSLQFQVDRTSTGGLGPGWMTGIYSGPKQPMLGENNPYKMFDRVFEGFSGGGVDQADQLRA